MDKWALKYQGRANFVCVGCDGPDLSTAMGTRMRLNNCVNGYIASQRDMPKWGQLGCSGFIILGSGDQRIITPKTSAFLEVEDRAFRQVESILDSELSGQQCTVHPGDHVKLVGLTKAPELNNAIALVMGTADRKTGRFPVQLLSDERQIGIKLANLVVLSQAEVQAALGPEKS